MVDKALFLSGPGEWGTPQWLYDELHVEFSFELDPAASDSNAKCDLYYTKEFDGLWGAWAPYRCFINPPYGRRVGEWLEKAFTESTHGALCVMLLPVRSDTVWWHKFVMHSTEMRFIEGRLKFEGAENMAPFPSIIVIWKPYGPYKPKIEKSICARGRGT